MISLRIKSLANTTAQVKRAGTLLLLSLFLCVPQPSGIIHLSPKTLVRSSEMIANHKKIHSPAHIYGLHSLIKKNAFDNCNGTCVYITKAAGLFAKQNHVHMLLTIYLYIRIFSLKVNFDLTSA
jgi:hypothetical protein